MQAILAGFLKMDKGTFTKHFERLVNVYGEPTAGFAATFFETVEWMDGDDFAEAVTAILRTFTPGFGVKWPSPGHLLHAHNDLLRGRPRDDDRGMTRSERKIEAAFRDVSKRIAALTDEEQRKLTALAQSEYPQLTPETAPEWLRWAVQRTRGSSEVYCYCRIHGLYRGVIIPQDCVPLALPKEDGPEQPPNTTTGTLGRDTTWPEGG
jgi:hypothetical protein